MSEIKQCRIATHRDPALVRSVQDMAFDLGYYYPSHRGERKYDIVNNYDGIAVGDYWHNPPTSKDLYHWDMGSNSRDMWPVFDARTQMKELRSYLACEPEPEYDESPLPYDMEKELAEATKKKFNLSDEQWEVLPPMARDALAGVEVKRVCTQHKWIPITEESKPPPGDTVIFTNNPEGARGDVCGHVKVGYEDEVMDANEGWVPTHYCEIPRPDPE